MSAAPRHQRLLRWARRHAAEIFSVVAALGTLAYLRFEGLQYGWNTVAYILPGQLYGIPSVLVVGVLLRTGATWIGRRSVRDYWRSIWSWRWLAGWLRFWLATSLVLYAYVWLKVSIPLVRPVLFDLELWRIDRFVHFGFAPSIFAVELAAGTVLPPLLDRWYSVWAHTSALMFAYLLASESEELRSKFVLATNLMWAVGAWLYLALPSIGPCYAFPEILEPIREQMPLAIETQRALWANYGLLVGSRSSGVLEYFSPLLGVAALPSLHVAQVWLFALWSRRHERPLYLVWVIATGLTLFGSVISGWHYAVDGYAGMLLAWLALVAAERVHPGAAAENVARADR